MSKTYDKLVRDRIPEIVRGRGAVPTTRTVEGSDLEARLVAKLHEEVAEFEESREPEELADVMEVLYALGKVRGVDEEGLEKLRGDKRAARGGFDDGIVLEKVVEPEELHADAVPR